MTSGLSTTRKKSTNQFLHVWVTPRHVEHMNVDTMAQQKAVAFHSDAPLYHKARRAPMRAAKESNIDLGQIGEDDTDIPIMVHGS